MTEVAVCSPLQPIDIDRPKPTQVVGKHPSRLDALWKPKSPASIELFSDRLSGPSPKRPPTRVVPTRASTEAVVCVDCQDCGYRSGGNPSGVADDSPTSWEGSSAPVPIQVKVLTSTPVRRARPPQASGQQRLTPPKWLRRRRLLPLRWVASTVVDPPTEVDASTTR